MKEKPVGTFLLTAFILWVLWLWRRHRIDGETLGPLFPERQPTVYPTIPWKPDPKKAAPAPAPGKKQPDVTSPAYLYSAESVLAGLGGIV